MAAIDVKAFRVKLDEVQQLHDAGLASTDQLRQAQVDLEKAEIQLAKVTESISNAETASDAELEGLALEARMLHQEQALAARQLDLATTKADRRGVLTWVVAEAGASVHKGDVLARIADLTTFRVRPLPELARQSGRSVGRDSKGLTTWTPSRSWPAGRSSVSTKPQPMVWAAAATRASQNEREHRSCRAQAASMSTPGSIGDSQWKRARTSALASATVRPGWSFLVTVT